jgi:hypothetical protein
LCCVFRDLQRVFDKDAAKFDTFYKDL